MAQSNENAALTVDTWAPRLSVTIDGNELTAAGGGPAMLPDVTVQLSLTEIDGFTLQVLNWDEQKRAPRFVAKDINQLLGRAPGPEYPFGLGKQVQISMGYPKWEAKLLTGEITRVRPVFPSSGPPMLIIDGADGLHRLKGGVRNKAYPKKTDSEIVQAVVDLANKENNERLKTEIERTTERFEMVCQFDLTDAGFLKERASRIGYELFVRDDTLYFRKPAEKETKGQLVLEWGKNLESLDVNVNVGNQVAQVEVRSMDRQQTEVISYKTTDGDLKALVPKGMSGAKARETLFGGKPLVITSIPVNTKEEAKAIAVARLRRAMEGFVTVRGATFGMPDLKPGTSVTLKGIDPLLEGDYYLTRCTHRFGAQGYRTDFEARRLEL